MSAETKGYIAMILGLDSVLRILKMYQYVVGGPRIAPLVSSDKKSMNP